MQLKITLIFFNMIKTLNSSNSSIRRSINKNRIFLELKCRPKLDNDTRWSYELLVLISVKRAYNNGGFNENNQCPFTFVEIELYIQVLLPAHQFSISKII